MFIEETSKWGAKLISLDQSLISQILFSAYNNRSQFPFKEHIRDYIIGVQSASVADKLITYNKTHFQWLHIPILTPEELIVSLFKK